MSTELATIKPGLLERMGDAAGLSPKRFYEAVKATCGCQGATDEHFAVLLMVADKYNLNPMLKQLYLMPTKKGVEPVIPIDGWVPLLVNHPDYLAHETVLRWEKESFVSKCVAATTRIWTQPRNQLGEGPFEHTEMMQECWKDSMPWKSHPTRMLGHKSVIQAARRCFGIYVMDSDEASGIGPSTEPRPANLTFKGTQTLPDDTNRQHEAYQSLAQRIATVANSAEASALHADIATAEQTGEITIDEATELRATLAKEMA